MTLVLGIETSCDETAAAVIADGREIRSNVVASQVDLHRQYGGVFPEMASRQHVISIDPVIREAMREAGAQWSDLAAVAVTYGPGLAGSLLVGVNVAKGLAYGNHLPLIGVNHLEAHIATNWLGGEIDEIGFPLLCLVVSGGHTALLLMNGYGEYHLLGSTLDDAAGEAFDKVARMLGLSYPGGPAIQRAAADGNPAAFEFPRARLGNSYDFSFSGLKTAVLRAVQQYDPGLHRPADKLAPPDQEPADVQESDSEYNLHPKTVANMAASFQSAVVDVLVLKTQVAANEYEVKGVLLAGGVAANQLLRQQMAFSLTVPLYMPPIALATDNATGVGVAGYWALQNDRIDDWDLDAVPNLRLA